MLSRILLGLYAVLFAVTAIAPFDRTVWYAEITPMILIVGALVLTRRWYVFSNLAYVMMTFLVVLHTIGAYYTFERVPFGWVTELFDFERNHYDRIGHFTVGFYAFAVAEVLAVKSLVRTRVLLAAVPIMAILAVAVLYEIFEWLYAIWADPQAGLAVLGSQGDIWDAQKDMLADGLGAVFATALFFAVRKPRRPAGT